MPRGCTDVLDMMGGSMTQVNISDVIDRSRFGAFQWGILILCSLCVIMDGFDVQAMGYIAPALVRDWHIPNSALGPVFSAALTGVLVGSLLCSMLADRIGRRPVLILGALYFSAFTLLTARANSVGQLLAIRFIAGIGLGGMMPNAMALVGEYSPKKVRITALMVIGCGFTAGAAMGGFVAAWLIPAFGWRSVFYFGGAVPLVIAVFMIVFLPESLQFLALRGKDPAKLLRWLGRIDPSANASTEYVVREEKKSGLPAIHLFREGRTTVTILLWVVNFMNLLNLYFLASWVPTVVRDAGYTTAIAVLVGTAVQVGGTVGAFGNAWFIGRVGFARALAPVFAVGAISIALIGQPFLTLPLLFAAVFIAGWCVTGGQPGVNSLAAVYYPTYLRSTGIGWGLGIGRIGAIIGPVVGGELMALKWAPREVFYAAAVPAAISAIVMFSLDGYIKKPARADIRAEVLAH
jgi:AAHS family 4-hydroxybenzoate transporter-like MFS transporter